MTVQTKTKRVAPESIISSAAKLYRSEDVSYPFLLSVQLFMTDAVRYTERIHFRTSFSLDYLTSTHCYKGRAAISQRSRMDYLEADRL